ncbi:MAG: NAD+ synthase [Alphaproteobacteria bacterium]|jgi:NAD+ synthase|nr:NAD+ synthase [Alphaproteobacteria bacterium]MBT4086464.1 NAD+ synthase [Alphaproteobacteria bacterium]MBT4546444.1 NAD+ synthase [Alphaproteobacteria bacterium]
MTDQLAIALAQLNPRVGDLEGNADLVRQAREQAALAGADLLMTSELMIVGYPPEDLVLRTSFLDAVEKTVYALAAETADGGPAILLGAPWRTTDPAPLKGGKARLSHNSVLLLDGGEVAGVRHKVDLPNYGVFDEVRVFVPGEMPEPLEFRGVKLGVPICEDVWTPEITRHLANRGAEILLVLNGSPFESGKTQTRFDLMQARIRETGLPLVYLNQFGGQDELVFDGASFVLNADGEMTLQMPSWQECVDVSQWAKGPQGWVCAPGEKTPQPDELAGIWSAMVVGLEDYVQKNHFPGVVLGMSGGIDSAVSAAVAVDALGADKVHCVMMPSRFTGDESLGDAKQCADALGVRYDSIAIKPAVESYEAMLVDQFADTDADTTEENIQARIRGVTLMALSNKFGDMVLTTGNKSEMSVGYATLYGDMCGGFSVLKDVYKTVVFDLARWRNAHVPVGRLDAPGGEVIPVNIIDKPPTAELRENQTDQDNLPPYEALDDMLICLVEDELPFDEIVARGHSAEDVRRIEHLLNIAEYKRRQAPPGVKIGGRNFGRDRRYPITNRFRDARRD